MLFHLTTLFLLPTTALSAAVIPPSSSFDLTLAPRAVSPDNTCGASNSGYTCPGAAPCCSQHGYCGSTDAFCLTTASCQTRYSNSSRACHAPVSGVSISIDGTCGTTGAGKNGYRCPGNATVISCCSQAGWCGNTRDHCAEEVWCQPDFGNCTARRGSRGLSGLLSF